MVGTRRTSESMLTDRADFAYSPEGAIVSYRARGLKIEVHSRVQKEGEKA